MSNQEILSRYPDLFELRSLPAWVFRYVEQFLFRLLYRLAEGMETLMNKLADLLAFFNQPEIQDFYQILALASFIFLALALMVQGYSFILGKRKTISDLFRNTILGVLFLIALPWTMTQFLEIAHAGVSALGTDEEGNVLLAKNVIYDNITDIEILAEQGEWGNLEARKNISQALPFEALDLTEPTDGESDVLKVKLVSNGTGVETQELDNGGLFSFWKEYYFRYSYDFLVITLEFLSLIMIYVFFAFKLISVSFELATTKLVAPFAINTDIGTGQKVKVVLKELINGFATFVSIFYILRLYQIFTAWLLGMDLFTVPILNAVVMLVVAFVVIDGTKTIPRIFGFDAGVKDGQSALFGLYAASRLGMSLGQGVRGLTSGVGNSLNHNAQKLGAWKEGQQGDGGIGHPLQTQALGLQENLRHPLAFAKNRAASSNLAHSFAQGGFQESQISELAMETGATRLNAQKALERSGNDPQQARSYLRHLKLDGASPDQESAPLNRMEKAPGSEAGSLGTSGGDTQTSTPVEAGKSGKEGAPTTKTPPLPSVSENEEKTGPPSAPLPDGPAPPEAPLNPSPFLNQPAGKPNDRLRKDRGEGVPLPEGEDSPPAQEGAPSIPSREEGFFPASEMPSPSSGKHDVQANGESHAPENFSAPPERRSPFGTPSLPERRTQYLQEGAVSPPTLEEILQEPSPGGYAAQSVPESPPPPLSGEGSQVSVQREDTSGGPGMMEVRVTPVPSGTGDEIHVQRRVNTDGTFQAPRMEELLEREEASPIVQVARASEREIPASVSHREITSESRPNAHPHAHPHAPLLPEQKKQHPERKGKKPPAPKDRE